MSDDIPLVEPKRPKIGDYVRSGSCLGEPQVMTNHISYLKFVIILVETWQTICIL